ncbi:MAG: hypothetical protein A2X45_22335 [Lentisphaerae bacterium GWF2_50_93]|nr:MAG: hypothetical protein A2X45_22335 [Lentisphaerae bacterium GWF2_50_93]
MVFNSIFIFIFIAVTAVIVSFTMFLMKPRKKAPVKRQEHSGPANEFETKLLIAGSTPITLEELSSLLLKTKLLVLGTISENKKIALKHWELDGKPVIPAFTSVERLRESISHQEHYIEMDACTFLKSIPGNSDVILNPNSQYALSLKHGDIGKITGGSDMVRHQTAP